MSSIPVTCLPARDDLPQSRCGALVCAMSNARRPATGLRLTNT
jgi:hypothetical protein